ncbi:MAG: DUF1579 family protein [Planctomycetes bacterium]|nr:DUF1579 family protein [Planctomycetota bacterium]
MIRFVLLCVTCAAVLATFSLIPLLGEDKIDVKPSEGTVMEQWKKLQQPGMEHQVLAKRAGSWLVTATCWKDGPNKPVTMAGNSEQRMVYDRYLTEEFSLGEGDSKMTGTGYIAFDNGNKCYEALYLGNMGTALCVLTGEHDTKTGELRLNSERTEKFLNNVKVKSRVLITGIVGDKYIVNIYQTIGSQPEARFMEMVYTRK